MSLASSLASKNISRKLSRSILMTVVVIFLSFTLFAGSFLILSLQRGLKSYRERLGADIVVIPNSSKGHGSVDDIFLQGITGNYYISAKDIAKIEAVEGIEQVSRQFYLTSAKASCCSTRIQIIGIDPETDFTIQPWISNNYKGTLAADEIIVGNSVSAAVSDHVKFYGRSYRVAAKLDRTGTGLDSAVFTGMDTIRQMAEDAGNLMETDAFTGVNIKDCASAVLIKVKDGYQISDVTDDINIHITKVQATSARSMISDIADGLGNVSGIIGFLVVLVFILAIVILAVVYALLSNERRKEFAVLRTIGASGKMLFGVMSFEALYIGSAGSVIGIILALILSYSLESSIKDSLELPYLIPDVPAVILIILLTFLIAVLTGIVISFISAGKIVRKDTGLLLREEN